MIVRLRLVVLVLVGLVAWCPTVPLPETLVAKESGSPSLVTRWIVQLHDPPLAQAPQLRTPLSPSRSAIAVNTGDAAAAPAGRLDLDTSAARNYRAMLERQQQQLIQVIRNRYPEARVDRTYQIVFNGFSVALPGVPQEEARAWLRSLEGVVQVSPEQVYEPAMYGSLPQMNTEALWNVPAIGGQGRAGNGIKIAVIDTGINVSHPFFNPAGFSYPPGYPKGQREYTTPKVIVARSYFRPDLPPNIGSGTPRPGPEDSSHGTHVAGIAAGVANTVANLRTFEQVISGVAPRAYLMNYKAFYANDSVFSGMAFETELIAAFEDAVADGADVINNSWGSRANVAPEFDAISVAARAAAEAGVVVVFSAGNNGPSKSTVDSRDIANHLLVVGATTTARTIAEGVVDVISPDGREPVPASLTNRVYGIATFGRRIDDKIGPAPYLPVQSLGVSALACEPLPPGTLEGKIAIVERGICHFSLKVFHAQQAGAVAVVVVNSAEGGEEVFTMRAGERGGEVHIPSVLVPHSMGHGMVEWYNRYGAAARLQIDPRARVVPRPDDVLASFSSRGPTFQQSLKPDVVAPGVDILSAGYSSGIGEAKHLGYGLASGTSMAAPHVSGGVALLRQAHPEWSPRDIRSALITTAEPRVWLDTEQTQLARVLDRGGGRVDLGRAVDPGLLFDTPSLSFSRLQPVAGLPTIAETVVQARNISGRRQTYTIRSAQQDEYLTIAVSPPELTIGAGQIASIRVSITLAPDAPPGDYGGMVALEGGPHPLHLPLWVRLLPTERAEKVLILDNDGSSSLELRNYADYYTGILSELGVSFAYLDVDAQAPASRTLPEISELQKYEIVLWFTGDNSLSSETFPGTIPLTKEDQDILMAYLQGGGNLIATGQNLADASDIEQSPPGPEYGRSELYKYFLGARFVQDHTFDTPYATHRVIGVGDHQWLSHIVLDLGSEMNSPGHDAMGAANQSSVDEIVVIDEDPRTPDIYTHPIFKAVSMANKAQGIVGLARYSDPTLEQPAVAFHYRTIILSFGLEGVRSDTGATTRKELLQSLLYWMVDRPTARVRNPVIVSQPEQLVSLTVETKSNIPAEFVLYRWDFGDGTPILSTTQPEVVHTYRQPGNYLVRVEVTDSWGHTTLAESIPASPVPPSPALSRPSPAAELVPVTFPETGHTLQGRFLAFWREHGGLMVFGYPIGPQTHEPPVTQMFERTRFEYRPEHAAPYDVLLGLLGVETLAKQGRNWRDLPTVDAAAPDCLYFPETRHSLCPPFRTYWERHGLEFDGRPGKSFAESLALFGYPISEPMEEVGEDGVVRTMQWFERARFEYHPGNDPAYAVLLSRLGSLP